MKRWTWITMLALLFIHSIATFAQQPERKVVRKVAPSYPEFARHVSLNGTVKLEAVVASDGTVRSVKIKGGHPVLAEAAVQAVNKWKFEPAANESHESVEVRFNPE
jgi:TonB family protein